jgi:hypothetical protein
LKVLHECVHLYNLPLPASNGPAAKLGGEDLLPIPKGLFLLTGAKAQVYRVKSVLPPVVSVHPLDHRYPAFSHAVNASQSQLIAGQWEIFAAVGECGSKEIHLSRQKASTVHHLLPFNLASLRVKHLCACDHGASASRRGLVLALKLSEFWMNSLAFCAFPCLKAKSSCHRL